MVIFTKEGWRGPLFKAISSFSEPHKKELKYMY